MSKEELKELIFEYVKERGHVTYVEIEELFEKYGFDYKGYLAQSIRQNPKVFFWIGWNDEAIDLLWELEAEEKIHKVPSSVLFYLVNGYIPELPVIKSKRIYKKEHWCPVAFDYGRGENSNENSK